MEKISAKSDTRLIVNPIAQLANKVSARVMMTAAANDDGFAPAQCEQHQQDHRHGCEHQLLDQLDRLVIGRLAVVARDSHFHAFRNDTATENLDSMLDRLGDVRRIGCRASWPPQSSPLAQCLARGHLGLMARRATRTASADRHHAALSPHPRETVVCRPAAR
jgi:hypothetical protein